MVRAWIRIGVMIIILFGLYLFTDSYMALIALTAIITLILLSTFLLFMMRKKVRIHLEAKWSSYRTEEGIVHMKVTNKSMFPMTKVTCTLLFHNRLTNEKMMKDVHFMIKGKGNTIMLLHFQSKQVGKIDVRVHTLTMYDYLQIRAMPIQVEAKCSTYVLPNRISIYISELDKQLGIDHSLQDAHESMSSDGIYVSDIKEYTEGDNAKHIHWKLTEKFHFPIVKEFSEPIEDNILILYDTFYSNDALAVSAKIEVFMSLSHSLLEQGYAHDIAWYDDDTNQARFEEVDQLEQLSVLQSDILATQHVEETSEVVDELITHERNYTHVYYITSKTNQLIDGLMENNHVTVLTYTEKDSDYQRMYEHEVHFTPKILEEDFGYLTM